MDKTQAMPKPPKVAVIIINFNGRRYLGELLDEAISSALNQTYTNIEIIFADNGSTDDSVSYISSKYGDKIRVVSLGKNYGFCLGNNLAVKYVSEGTEYMLFMNSDVILSRDYVLKLVRYLQTHSNVGAVQGLDIRPKGVKEVGGLVTLDGGWKSLYNRSNEVPVLAVSGAAMLIRRDAFLKVGGFPSEFFMQLDDIDLGFRLQALGYKLTGTTITNFVHYAGSTTSKTSLASAYCYDRNRILICIRYFVGKYFMKALLLNAISLLLDLTLRGFKGKLRVRLALRIILYMMRNVRRELSVRKRYIKLVKRRWPTLVHFICSS